MTRPTRRIAVPIAALALAGGLLLAAGCGDDDEDTSSASAAGGGVEVTVADKGFTESFIVAEAYAQALDAQGFSADVTSLASTEIADAAVLKGDIDVYPEYTGTAYLNVLELPAENPPSFEEQFTEIQTAYADRGLTAFEPAPYNNGNEVACTPESGITTLEQLGEESGDIVYSANAEHLTRPDGLPLLEEEYGVDFKDVITVDISLRYQPVEDGKAQCVYAFGTDPQIAEQGLVVLEDGKGLFTGGVSFQNFAVVNTAWYEALTDEQRTAFDEAINGVDAALTADAIRSLNAQVEFDKEDPEDVAAAFLEENGLAGS